MNAVQKKLQVIYTDALARPAGGFAGSPRFKLAPFTCPSCDSDVYVRYRFHTPTPIGATCGSCDWLTTYVIPPALPAAPVQPDLF